MKVVCEHCGLPFSLARPSPGRPVFCCSGCALAARISSNSTRGPVVADAMLVTALSAGFGFFNQVLGWLLARLLAHRHEAADLLALGSLLLGTALCLGLAYAQSRAGARRVVDGLVFALVAALWGLAWSALSPACGVAANTAFALWSLRGTMREKVSGKK